MARWRDRALASRGELRPVPAESLHVTLVFLGWTDPASLEAIRTAAIEALDEKAPPPVLTPAGLVGVPRRRPRLVALDLIDEDGRAATLRDAVAAGLAGAELYEPEARPFWPHVTLARVRRGARWRPLEGGGPGVGRFTAARVTLYRSHLTPSGARYEALCRHPLG